MLPVTIIKIYISIIQIFYLDANNNSEALDITTVEIIDQLLISNNDSTKQFKGPV